MIAILFLVVTVLVAFVVHLVLRGNYAFGLYRHYKGGFYLGLCRSWESDNDAERVRRVLYFSFDELQLDDRTECEFLSFVNGCTTTTITKFEPRFKRVLPPWQPEAL